MPTQANAEHDPQKRLDDPAQSPLVAASFEQITGKASAQPKQAQEVPYGTPVAASFEQITGKKSSIPQKGKSKDSKVKPKGGIELRDTAYGKVRIYKVTSGNYPIQIAQDTLIYDIYELALLQHPTIVQKLGLRQKGYFDYNALVQMSRDDRDFEYWIKGFAKQWIVHPDDELLLDRLPGIPLPKEKKNKKERAASVFEKLLLKDKKPDKPKYRKANDVENWLKKNVSPDEADRIFDALGNLGAKRHRGLMKLIKRKGLDPEKDKAEIVKVLYNLANEEKKFPGGASNSFHTVYQAKTKVDGKDVRIYESSKKYPGLFTTDGKQCYYASETGPVTVHHQELADGTWKKYVK